MLSRFKRKLDSNSGKAILFAVLFCLAFLERVVFDLGDNVELVTSALILGTFYLGTKNGFLLTFLIIALSDLIIGNTNIYLFTWSGFLIPTLLSNRVINYLQNKIKFFRKIPGTSIFTTAIAANLFFFFWTNLGVWLLDSQGMYSKDLVGLVTCYFRALPFLKNQLISSVVFIPLGLYAINFSFNFKAKLNNLINLNFR